jgi:hypothetical protein
VRSEENVTGSTMKPARRSQVNKLASMFDGMDFKAERHSWSHRNANVMS